ncbi:hypothetical protein CRUP_032926 [Coryphaenoides rupestris]|nr:hypothetical protein CRUP_032926 [Coryphaenoides rupestris]
MRILVNLLLDTLPMLGNVLLLCFFVFFIFGIIGVQLGSPLQSSFIFDLNVALLPPPASTTGVRLPRPYYMADEDDERPFICSLPMDNGIMACSDMPARREGERTCCLDKEDALYRRSLGLSPDPHPPGPPPGALANGSHGTPGLCVNWNQYYTRCQTGHSNPHKGAILRTTSPRTGMRHLPRCRQEGGGGWVAGWLGGWVIGWLGVWVAGWLGDWVAGWLGVWVAGWLGGWVVG